MASAASARDSLEKLDVTQVDVFCLHAPVYDIPIEETLSGVDAAYREGVLRRFGLSNYPPAEVQRVYNTCVARGYILSSVYQGSYSAITRRLGMSFYAYSPIAGGFLTKTRDQIERGESRFNKDQMFGCTISYSSTRRTWLR